MTAAAACALAACSDSVQPTAPEQAVFVGRIAGSDIAMAVVIEDGAALAYVCGGPQTLDTHTTWMRGAERGSAVSAQSATSSLTAVLSERTLDGTLVDTQGIHRHFSLTREDSASRAGLYESTEGACRTGVILFDATSGAAQGAGCDALGRRSQVTPVRPMTVSTNGLAAHAALSPERVLYVRPVRPALVAR